MNKRAIFILIFLVFIIIFTLIFLLQKGNNSNNKYIDDVRNINYRDTIEASASDEKTTPNTILVLKKEYKKCGHTIKSSAKIFDEMVNMTKEEIEEAYPDWKIEEFSKDQVVMLKQIEGFCGEHYLLSEKDGVIVIYSVDENENRTLKERTNISTEYLTETDKIALKNEIMVYGRENLNKALEDFEA